MHTIPCVHLFSFPHLRSLELKRVSLLKDVHAAQELAAAHAHVKQSRSSLWSADLLNQTSGGALPSLNGRNPTLRDLHAAGDTAGMLALAKAADAQAAAYAKEEIRLSEDLPDVVQKLILGYELRVFYFELIECTRKLLIVCVPVFFTGVAQLIFGLVVCFLTFGAYMMFSPYAADNDDRIAQLCQVQIFFALLCAVMLKYTPEQLKDAFNVDALLSILTVLPIGLATYLETPLAEHLAPSKLAEQSKGFQLQH